MTDDESNVRRKFLALAVAGAAFGVVSGGSAPVGAILGGVLAVGAAHRALGERNYWGQTVVAVAALAVAAGVWRLRSAGVDVLALAYLGIGVAGGIRAGQYLRYLRRQRR